ncbi:MAG TPA: transcriptional regulator GcvA [Candidatus Sulfotelmatobacter sp.]|nr:transcriptional regulator GcvA [Candidatus Sulfotelmatobacter sp.]
MRSLPPLNGLRAFEAAARHLSFARAAGELNVTPAAISHQIKALEARLGTPLFRRRNREVLLTDAGQALLPGVRDGFDRLAAAAERVQSREAVGALNVSVLPSLAARWLVPRLARFHARHPDIDLRLSATQNVVDFSREDFDAAIRHGRGTWPGLRCDLLLRDEFFPVCSPSLREGPLPLRTPEDLRHHVLLHDSAREDWRLWLAAAGIGGIDLSRGPSFNDGSLLVQAVVAGQGVAVGRRALVAGELAAGRLVRPFDVVLPVDRAYYLVCPAAAAERPKIAAFRAWLMAEAAEDEG